MDGLLKVLDLANGVESKEEGRSRSAPLNHRKTKITATIGKYKSVEFLSELMRAGMNVARMNFSHGLHPDHLLTINNVRKASEETGIYCAIMLDDKGPEIRTGNVEGDEIHLERGQPVNIHCAPDDPNFLGTSTDISVDYKNMPNFVKRGTFVQIADGQLQVEVLSVDHEKRIISGIVVNSQTIGNHKGVNLPGCNIDLANPTDKDKEDIAFGVRHRVDFVAPSFINTAQDVRNIKKAIEDGAVQYCNEEGLEGEERTKFIEDARRILVICKIESADGLTNFDAILEESDGIMVARGDLGVEIPIEKVCMAQKTMIAKCNAAGKVVITATEMLDSMIENPRATVAENNDVANAVFDGSDCVMLSGETAKGSFPREAVEAMAAVCLASESSLDHETLYLNALARGVPKGSSRDIRRTESLCSGAVKTALDLDATLVFALTESGRTAHFASKYRPSVPIICVTPNEKTLRQSLLWSGVWPLLVKQELDDTARLEYAIDQAIKLGWCQKGDMAVIVSGRSSVTGSSYQVRALVIGEEKID